MEVIGLEFSEHFLRGIKMATLWFFMAVSLITVSIIIESYNISDFQSLVIVVLFYISVTCFNRVIYYFIEDIKEERGVGKHAK